MAPPVKRSSNVTGVVVGDTAARAAFQAVAGLGRVFELADGVLPRVLSVMDGAGGRTDYAPGVAGAPIPLNANNPVIAPQAGVGFSTTAAFVAPAGALYGRAWITNAAPLALPPWPVPFAAVSNSTGDVFIDPADTKVKINWIDPAGLGVAANAINALVTLVWYS